MSAEKIFEQIQLSEASYANLSGAENDDDILMARLRDKSNDMEFSEAQASELIEHWKVADHQPNTLSNFSATLFESKDRPGEFTLAIRGTEPWSDIPTDVGDIVVDGLAIYQIVDLYNYWQRLITPSDQRVTLAKLVTAPAGTPESSLIFDVQSPGNAVALVVQFEQSTDFGLGKVSPGISSTNIAGHSLGGHLAMAFTRLFPEAGASAYTANAAGFGTQSSVDNLFNALAQKQTSFDSSAIVNIFGGAGAEFVTQDGLLEQYGQRVSMFIESAKKGTFGHGVGQLTDSAAVFDLFVRMDPALRALPLQDAVDKVASILRSADADPDMSVESVVGALARLFDVDGLIGSGLEDDRQAIYSRVNAVREASSGGAYSVISLADQDASALEALSYGDIAYRYALKALNPFAILGTDYGAHNEDGELDVYDEEVCRRIRSRCECEPNRQAAQSLSLFHLNESQSWRGRAAHGLGRQAY